MTNGSTAFLAGTLATALCFFSCDHATGQSTVVGTGSGPINGSTVIRARGTNVQAAFPRSSLNARARAWESILARTYPARFVGRKRCDQVIREMREIGLPVVLDSSAEDDSLTHDEPLELILPQETLFVRLQTALQKKNAVLAIVGDRLMIVSLDVIQDPEYFLTVTYDVSELGLDQSSLVEQVKINVSPDDWFDTSGDAVLEAFVISGRRAMTLSAPYPTHRQVQEYLRGLKQFQGDAVADEASLLISPLTASRVIELPGTRARQRSGRRGLGGGGIGGYGLGGGVF